MLEGFYVIKIVKVLYAKQSKGSIYRALRDSKSHF